MLEVGLVTAVAAGLLVFAIEGKLGLFVMIELGAFPTLGGMAVLALAAVFAGVDVIETMTVDTKLRRFFVLTVDVTEVAADVLVFAGQFIFGLAVIKCGFAPLFFVVALVTLLAKLFLMYVLFLVAGITGVFGFAIGLVGHMAGATGGLEVGALKGVISLAVIE